MDLTSPIHFYHLVCCPSTIWYHSLCFGSDAVTDSYQSHNDSIEQD